MQRCEGLAMRTLLSKGEVLGKGISETGLSAQRGWEGERACAAA